MSKPFQPISDIINTSSTRHKQQSFNEIYGEPENFLEIEVCKTKENNIIKDIILSLFILSY